MNNVPTDGCSPADGTTSTAGANGLVGSDCLDHWLCDRPRGSVDVVLITHPRDEHDLPRLFPGTAPMTPAGRRAVTRRLKPIFGEIIRADRLGAAILFLPIYADQIIDPRERKGARQLLEEGLEAVARVAPGSVVCLGGLTGSLSGYGRKIEAPAHQLGLRLTTGHSATAISVLRTYLRALDDLALRPESKTMVILGVGSVGGAFAELLFSQGRLPKKVVLVDRPARRTHMEEMSRRLAAVGPTEIEIECTSSAGAVEPTSSAYRCTFLITAVITPSLIDPDLVAPGTVLVDDSQPYCWDRGRAWSRVQSRGDIAPCEAGLVDAGAIGFRSHFPFDFADHGADGSSTSWSCLAEGMLRALQPDLPATLGEPSGESLLRYSQAFDAHAFGTPALQCGERVLPVEVLRHRFQSIAAGSEV